MATLRLFFASAKNANKSQKRTGDGEDAAGAGDILDDALGDALRDALSDEDDGDATDDVSSEDSQS